MYKRILKVIDEHDTIFNRPSEITDESWKEFAKKYRTELLYGYDDAVKLMLELQTLSDNEEFLLEQKIDFDSPNFTDQDRNNLLGEVSKVLELYAETYESEEILEKGWGFVYEHLKTPKPILPTYAFLFTDEETRSEYRLENFDNIDLITILSEDQYSHLNCNDLTQVSETWELMNQIQSVGDTSVGRFLLNESIDFENDEFHSNKTLLLSKLREITDEFDEVEITSLQEAMRLKYREEIIQATKHFISTHATHVPRVEINTMILVTLVDLKQQLELNNPHDGRRMLDYYSPKYVLDLLRQHVINKQYGFVIGNKIELPVLTKEGEQEAWEFELHPIRMINSFSSNSSWFDGTEYLIVNTPETGYCQVDTAKELINLLLDLIHLDEEVTNHPLFEEIS